MIRQLGLRLPRGPPNGEVEDEESKLRRKRKAQDDSGCHQKVVRSPGHDGAQRIIGNPAEADDIGHRSSRGNCAQTQAEAKPKTPQTRWTSPRGPWRDMSGAEKGKGDENDALESGSTDGRCSYRHGAVCW